MTCGVIVISIIAFIGTAIFDIYTTKRAMFDIYRGRRLPIKEINPIIIRLWKLADIDVTKIMDDEDKRKGIIMTAFLKSIIFFIFIYSGLTYVNGMVYMVGGLVLTSVLQLIVGFHNMRLIKKTRQKIDSRLGAAK